MLFRQFRFLLVFLTILVLAPSALADRSEVVFGIITHSTDGENTAPILVSILMGNLCFAELRARKFGGSRTVAGTVGSQSISPAQSVDKANKMESFASDNYFDGKVAFDAKNYKRLFSYGQLRLNKGIRKHNSLSGPCTMQVMEYQRTTKKPWTVP